MPHLPETSVPPQEDLICSICCYRYCRKTRLPRVLHCSHTFCAVCLENISSRCNVIHTARCPLCRWTTCTPSALELTHYLNIDTEIWDQITAETEPLWVLEDVEVEKDTNPEPKRKDFKSKLQQFFQRSVAVGDRRGWRISTNQF
ncbi:RING finger protein 224 [Austrofundulus limnaeus]|uniref:RING finger protein 224-like n=1 Tax=Austrofundulus limnaeus TaxID=52670 RepID=A0A2I4AQ22_AUSLI|nr:PREDICTED: RING finger protein 224-like [Austrofundulus limnaeus]XP_013857588.1 PREDICTED: RING finger protein 224-like [Austrofundulus limnaeus]